jgi:hypothetical protein
MRSVIHAALAAVLASAVLIAADPQGQGTTPAPWPLSNAVRERGSSVTGAFEGWFYNPDGSQSLLVGYFNRNTKQELDIPVGPNNRIEPLDAARGGPSGPDFGQPTHFLTGRQWGVFAIKLPKNFGSNELTWTLVTNGQTNVITLHTRPDWIVEPFEDPANKNRPPALTLQPQAGPFSGPPSGVAAAYSVQAGVPLDLVAFATDAGPKINVADPSPSRRARGASGAAVPAPPRLAVSWSLFRGPGAVTFSEAKPSIDRDHDGKTSTTATFTVPGDYVLRLQANDSTGDGGGGFQCCWTNLHVAVTVKPTRTDVP